MIEFDIVLQPAPRGVNVQTAPRQATQSWLREWEQARWQEQPRYEVQAQQDHQDQPVAPELSAALAPTVAAAQPLAESQAAPTSHDNAAQATEHALGAHVPSVNTVGALVTPHSSHPNTTFAMVKAVPALTLATNAKTTHPVASVAESASKPEWAAQSVHVHVGELATSVWIRDANLTPQQALALFERLRPDLQAASGAPRPLHLTLNGQAVAHEPLKTISST
jgi:hypothetical protein